MPWTRKQVKKLLSSGSPLTSKEKAKMKRELHANPQMGHMKKGYKKHEAHRGLRRKKGKDTDTNYYA